MYVSNNFIYIYVYIYVYIYIYITDANERISTQYSSLNVIYSFLITNVRTCRYYDYVYTTVLLQYIYIYILYIYIYILYSLCNFAPGEGKSMSYVPYSLCTLSEK